jgi:hypothetical protein
MTGRGEGFYLSGRVVHWCPVMEIERKEVSDEKP